MPTPSAAAIAELRTLIAEPDDSNGFTDVVLSAMLAPWPLVDERGERPYTWDTATTPPTQDDNEEWVETWDYHAAAAEGWQRKADTYGLDYDFSADGASYQRSQVYERMMARVRYHRMRRAPKSALTHKWPKEVADPSIWIGNLPEPTDE